MEQAEQVDPLRLRARWDAAPQLHKLFISFDAWARWMIQSDSPEAIDESLCAASALYELQAQSASARLALLRDPGAFLPLLDQPAKHSGLDRIYERGTFWIYGPITRDRPDLVSPLSVQRGLAAANSYLRHAGELHLRISSPGGHVESAATIGAMFSGWGARTRIRIEIDHMCHSAAALFLLPIADHVVMREGATLMLHESGQHFWGRASDFRRFAREQRRSDEQDWRAFASARRIPYARVRRLALGEIFLSARQALRLGLVDEIAPALPALNSEDHV